MHFVIDNFGPLHYYEFDLGKDIQLIIGKNNIGKSYAITLLYLFLKQFMKRDISLLNQIVEIINLYEPNMNLKMDSNYLKEKIDFTMRNILDELLASGLNESLIATYNSILNLKNKYNSAPMN